MQSYTNKDKKTKKMFFLILGLLGYIYLFIFVVVEVRAFIIVVLKNLAFSTIES